MRNREAFEEWYSGTYHETIHMLPNGQYSSLRCQHSWDAWQSRVPEGYVVAPVKCTNNMAHAAKEVDGRLSAFKYGDVWKVMIEAVEK